MPAHNQARHPDPGRGPAEVFRDYVEAFDAGRHRDADRLRKELYALGWIARPRADHKPGTPPVGRSTGPPRGGSPLLALATPGLASKAIARDAGASNERGSRAINSRASAWIMPRASTPSTRSGSTFPGHYPGVRRCESV